MSPPFSRTEMNHQNVGHRQIKGKKYVFRVGEGDITVIGVMLTR